MHNVIGRDVRSGGNPDEEDNPVDIVVEAQLPGFQIDIAGQDIVQNDIFDKIAPVVLFIIILLDAGQGHRQQRRELGRLVIRALHKQDVLGAGTGTERLIRIAALDEQVLRGKGLGRHSIGHLADPPEIAAGDDGQRFINDTNGAVNGLPHLMDNTLKKPV